MSANPGGSGVLAGTINGCVFAQSANTLAGTTNVGAAHRARAPSRSPEHPSQWQWDACSVSPCQLCSIVAAGSNPPIRGLPGNKQICFSPL